MDFRTLLISLADAGVDFTVVEGVAAAQLGRGSLAAVDALRIEALPPLSPPDDTTSA